MFGIIDLLIYILVYAAGAATTWFFQEKVRHRARRTEDDKASRNKRASLADGLKIVASNRYPGCIEIHNDNEEPIENIRIKLSIEEWRSMRGDIREAMMWGQKYLMTYSGTGLPGNDGEEVQVGTLILDAEADPEFASSHTLQNQEGLLVPVASVVKTGRGSVKARSGSLSGEYIIEFAGPMGVRRISGDNRIKGKGMACLVTPNDGALHGMITLISGNSSIVSQAFRISYSVDTGDLLLTLQGERTTA